MLLMGDHKILEIIGLAAILCSLFGNASAKQEFIVEPSNITVLMGDSVTFPCKVKDLKGTIQWTMDGFGLGTDRDLVAFQRFMMVGSEQAGNYSLHITTALLADEADYQCQVGGSDGEEPLRSRVANLTVLYPPKDDEDQVYIDPGSPVEAISGSTVRITCRGGRTKPVSKITWYKGDTEITEGVDSDVETTTTSKLKSITSWVEFTPDNSYHKENISCQISHPALESPIVRSVIMRVQYPPTVTIATHFIQARETDTIKFTCTADGNPPNFRFRWEVNAVGVGDHLPELTMRKVTRKDNGATVTCVVSNSSGNGRSTHTLDVKYEPIFKEEPKDADAEDGNSVELKCLVDSNPEPEIVWTHDDSRKVLGHGSTWSVTVTKESIGVYRCRVATAGYPEISRSMMVFMRGAPKIPVDQVIYGLEGNSVDVDCLIESIPRPEVIWSKNGVVIDGTSTRYEIHHLPERNGVRSRLIVHNSIFTDFGMYNCTAKNDYGWDTDFVELRRQRSLPIITALVAVVGAIVFVVVLSVAVFLFKKQGKVYGGSSTEKDSTQVSDHSSTQDSVLKVDSRTVTASDMSQSDDDSQDWRTNNSSTISGANYLMTPSEFFRLSGEFTEPTFPPKNTPKGGMGYIPYVDYSRDYNPPPSLASPSMNRNSIYGTHPMNNIDPRYSAVYGNPYLRVPPNARVVKTANDAKGSYTNLSAQNIPTQNNNLNNATVNKNILLNPINQQNNLLYSNRNNQYIKLQQIEDQKATKGTEI